MRWTPGGSSDDVEDRRNDGVRVSFGDAWALLKLPPFLVVEQSDPNGRSPNLESVGADQRARQVLLHVGVHSRDDGYHRDEERHRHNDPEKREERPQLIDADLFERGGDYVGEAH